MSDSDLLIIQDYESNLKIVDQIIERIDKRPFQVLIEAVIISVDLERTRQLGVNFALVDNLGTALGTVGSGAALEQQCRVQSHSIADDGRTDCRLHGRPDRVHIGGGRREIRLCFQ